MEETLGAGWAQASRTVEQEMVAWRRSHPRASLTEIELAVEAATAKMQAYLISDLAQGISEQVEGEMRGAGRPPCPQCQRPLYRRGRRVREVMVAHQERPMRLTRDYYVCPTCGVGLFPPG